MRSASDSEFLCRIVISGVLFTQAIFCMGPPAKYGPDSAGAGAGLISSLVVILAMTLPQRGALSWH